MTDTKTREGLRGYESYEDLIRNAVLLVPGSNDKYRLTLRKDELDGLLAALRPTEPAQSRAEVLEEEIARLIDPAQWKFIDWATQSPRPAGVPLNEDPRERFGKQSLGIARQILGLLSPDPKPQDK